MNLKHIENIVNQCKSGNTTSKQQLAEEFKPLILNLSLKYKITGYDFQDLKNECFKTLFIALDKYDVEKHRFVAYATISIQNHLKVLLRNSKVRERKVNIYSPIDENLEDDNYFEETVCDNELKGFMKKCFKLLNKEEKELVNFVYFQNKSVRAFALKNELSYHYVRTKNKMILQKLKNYIEAC